MATRGKSKNHKLLRSAKHRSDGRYTRQFSRTEKNRKRKLIKHLRKHSRDRQAKQKLDNLL